ncbi:MAG: GntR family transcriptional regulator [Phenylobacterium sp.]|uniref:GntR family transcriptional regulator n=1 Tax=Phenylobacterium sp. TaxID=1871053 RepID=UPI0025EC5492|nr:GntR family transcriptional regulator [Phenylobacterium sp.]MBI1198520.1 GntR family transcriptional regulator [Phenylobacterium sp.]
MDFDTAAEFFVREILAGRLEPGARLTERDITEACACTHAFARNVIQTLQSLGAVRFDSRRGARVISPADADPDQVGETWAVLARLLERKSGEPFAAASGETAYLRLTAVRAEIDRLTAKGGNARLAHLLKRVALQHEIVRSGGR